MRLTAVLLLAALGHAAPGAKQLLQQAAEEAASGAQHRALLTAAAAEASARVAKDRVTQARALEAIGQILMARGDFDRAAARAEQAASLSRAEGSLEQAARQLTAAGSARDRQGRYDEAYRRFHEAEVIIAGNASESWAVERRRVNMVGLATLYERLGMLPEAMTFYRSALNASGLDAVERARLRSSIGMIHHRLGDPSLAVAEYMHALDVLGAEGPLELRLEILERRAIAEAGDLRDLRAAEATLHTALELARGTGGRPVARVLLHLAGVRLRAGKPEAAEPEFEAALHEARKAKARREEWMALAGLGRYAEAIDIIETLRPPEAASLLRPRLLPRERDVYDAAISRLLGEGAPFGQLLSLIERGRVRTFSGKLVPRFADPASLRARLDSQTILLIHWQHQSEEAVLWCTTRAWGVAPDFDRIEALADPAVTRIVFVPGGPLLTSPDTLAFRGAPWIDRFEVVVLPAASLLLRDAPVRSWLAPWNAGLTAAGVTTLPRDPLPQDANWRPAARAAEELESAAVYVPGAAQIFIDADASRSDFMASVSRGYVLHVAAPAATAVESPDRSRVLLGGRTASYLYQSEIPSLPLMLNHLTVLSACETERGGGHGDAVHGLGMAFLSAGAASVMTTLWRVDDKAAFEMMKSFYAAVARGMSKAAALRETKIQLMRSSTSLADPKHWSAFVLMGDGWSPLPRVIPWSALLLAAAAVIGIARWGWRLRKQ